MNNVYRLVQKVRIDYMEILVGLTQSQATALAASDLYNRVRFALVLTGETFLAPVHTPYLSTNVSASMGDITETQKVYLDLVQSLTSQAFNAADYNAPQVKDFRFHVPLNLTLDCVSTTASGSGATWDTRKFNLWFENVSDSSVAPHPAITYSARVFYTPLNR
jgi:hypothetical protein